MHPAIFASVAAATLSAPSPRPSKRPSPVPVSAKLSADELYSLRERRRIATYLRLRLAEMRRERLDRVVDVIERRLPASALLDEPTPAPELEPK